EPTTRTKSKEFGGPFVGTSHNELTVLTSHLPRLKKSCHVTTLLIHLNPYKRTLKPTSLCALLLVSSKSKSTYPPLASLTCRQRRNANDPPSRMTSRF